MEKNTTAVMKGLYRSPKDSHKGMNGRLLVIGGSKLFHASIFWSADVASRIVDLVHFSSPSTENNTLVRKRAKAGFWNGIVVPWERVEEYILEDDCILIGPGMPRKEGLESGEVPTGEIVDRLLKTFTEKRWVIDGGALQEMNVDLLNRQMIVTPHAGEFKRMFGTDASKNAAQIMANKYHCVVLLKGITDVVCDETHCEEIRGGNEGMTKGGTGDVLAGLVAGLYCKNDAFLAATAGSLINKKAGDRLFQRVGPFFNASDLVDEIPLVMKELFNY